MKEQGMAVSGLSQAYAAVGAYNSQAQAGDAQGNLLATLQPKESVAQTQFSAFGHVQSFNNLNKVVNDVSSQKLSALNWDLRPGQALNEIRQAVAGASDTSIGPLQKLGIERQKDGTLSIDQKTLEQSVRTDQTGASTTLVAVADRVGKAIDIQLSSSGAVAKKAQDLSAQVKDLENTRNAAQARLDNQNIAQQHLTAQLASVGGYAARNAVTTYFNVATL